MPVMNASATRPRAIPLLCCACWLLLILAPSCHSSSSEPLGTAVGGGGDSSVSNPGNSGAIVDSAVGFEGPPDGGGSEGESPAVSYVPETNYPFDDEYLVDGSFESNAGFGWDTCRSRTPGGLSGEMPDEASHGTRSFRFQSGPCGQGCDASNPSSAQVYLWFNETSPIGDPVGLYFDIVNRDPGAPSGNLTLYGVDSLCVGDDVLGAVDLAELSPISTWGVRCVNVSAVGYRAIGVAVSGDAFNIGLDAFRLGPSCQRPVDCSATECICRPGLNQSCNDSPTVSSFHGACLPNATCACHAGFAKNPLTGKCL